MKRRGDNPFRRYGLDVTQDLASITERLRQLADDAVDPEERRAIREAWEQLTRSPVVRFELALDVSPARDAVPPPASATESSAPPFDPTLLDLLAPAPLAPRLGPLTESEQRVQRADLTFLLREDEEAATGPIGGSAELDLARDQGPTR